MEEQQRKRIKLEEKSSSSSLILWPILPENLTRTLPLIDVYIATIKNPKTTSQLIQTLNKIIPNQSLQYLKRVNSTRKILLAPTNEIISIEKLAETINDVINLLEKDFEIVSVAGIPPKTVKQYNEARKLWPCNFHPNNYIEKLTTNRIFSCSELRKHEENMKMAIRIAQCARVKNSTLVIDPKTNKIVAFGYEQSVSHPLRHSVMVGIDNVAKTQNGGCWEHPENYKQIEIMLKKQSHFSEATSNSEKQEKEEDEGPYLCTGYSLYTTFEPCITCAMALIHSRVKRVFYGAKSERGGLGTLCKVHCVEQLNHHYEVYAGLLEQECLLL